MKFAFSLFGAALCGLFLRQAADAWLPCHTVWDGVRVFFNAVCN